MRLTLGIITTFCLTFTIQAQKQLTLEEAVLGQYGQFRPAAYNGLSWLGETKDLMYFSARYDAIKRMSIGDKQGSDWFSLADVNSATGAKLPHLYGIDVISEQEVIFKTDSDYYSYNPEAKTGKKLLSFSGNGENLDFKNGYLAYTLKNNLFLAHGNQRKIAVTDFQDKNIVSGQAIARSEFGITKGIFWSPNGTKLAFYQKDESNVSNYPLLDVTTTPGRLRSIKYPMAGQRSEQARIGIYNLETKKTVYIKPKGQADQYLTNLTWSPDEKTVFVAVVNRGQNQMVWAEFDASTGHMVKTHYKEKHPKYVEPEHNLWFIPGSASQYIMFSEKDGYMHLYMRNTQNEGEDRQITKGNYTVLNILGLDYKKKHIIFLSTDESGLNTVVKSVPLKGGDAITITKVSGKHGAQLNTGGRFIIDTYSNLTTPSIQQLISVKGKLIGPPLTNSSTPYETGQLGTTEFKTLSASDGTPLHARLIKPSHFDSTKTYPVLVYVYGGPHAQMITNSWLGGAPLWMHYMAQKGYIIWTLDNRGSANRGRDFENIIHRQLGNIEMEDQMVGVNYLKNLPYVDGTKMAVHGWSFGGFMSTSLMLREPGAFQVGVAGGPVTDWAYYEIMYGERYMDTPKENAEGYANAKLHNYVKNLEGDLLLIHGTVDDVVVMQHNLSLVKAFVDADIQMDFFPYPNHPHNVRGKDRVHLMRKVINYIDDKLDVD